MNDKIFELQRLERELTWQKHKEKVEQMYMKARMDLKYTEMNRNK